VRFEAAGVVGEHHSFRPGFGNAVKQNAALQIINGAISCRKAKGQRIRAKGLNKYKITGFEYREHAGTL